MRENLIIITAGIKSLHFPWLRLEERSFDLFVVDYSPDQALKDTPCEYYLAQEDAKWFSTSDAMEVLGEKLDLYHYIWCPDDDLFIQPDEIDAMFALAKKLRLDLGQPALTRSSYYSFRITLQIPFMSYRLTNFIEIMAPFFTPSLMRQVQPYFKVSQTGWGMDHIWQNMVEKGKLRMGIIDRHPIVHTRPGNAPKKDDKNDQGGGFYSQSKANPWKDMVELAQNHDGAPLTQRTYQAVLRGGLPIFPFLAKRLSKLAKKKKKKKKSA